MMRRIVHKIWVARQAWMNFALNAVLSVRNAISRVHLSSSRERLSEENALGSVRRCFVVATADVVQAGDLEMMAKRCRRFALMEPVLGWSAYRVAVYMTANAVCSIACIHFGKARDALHYAERGLANAVDDKLKLPERGVMRSLVFSYCFSGVILATTCGRGDIALRREVEARLTALIRTIEADLNEAKLAVLKSERASSNGAINAEKRVRNALAIATSHLAMLYFGATGPSQTVRELLLRCASIRQCGVLDVERAEMMSLAAKNMMPLGWAEYTKSVEHELEAMHPAFRRRIVDRSGNQVAAG